MDNEIKLFEGKQVRSVWNNEKEEWYFSVVDVVAILTDSKNPSDYLKKIRKCDEQLATCVGINCPMTYVNDNLHSLKLFY